MSATILGSLTTDVSSREPMFPAYSEGVPARFPGLVARVSHWQLIQSTRIKVELPEKAIARQGMEAPEWLTVIRETLDQVEATEEKLILREWRTHPLREWGLGIRGLGEHSLAVLVGLLDGDPYIAYPRKRIGPKGSSKWIDEQPYVRTFGQLRAYCGAGDPERKRHAGMSQEDALASGKPLLKSRLWSIADIGVKLTCDAHRQRVRDMKEENGKPPPWMPPPPDCTCEQEGLILRVRFDRARLDACEREDWTDAHRRNHALRISYKEFLRDLYIESERLHREGLWKPQ